MISTVPKAVRIWGRGQLTIPKDLREALGLEEENRMSLFAVGRCLVLTPKRLLRASLAGEVGQAMQKKSLGLEDLLKTLKEERRRYNQAAHGL